MSHTIITQKIKTPIATMLAGVVNDAVCLLEFTDTHRVEMQISRLKVSFEAEVQEGQHPLFSELKEQLDAYFSGQLIQFDLPINLQGTDFQRKAWDALCEIPYGETRSYLEQAKTIGNPKAFRAVASANRNNKISIIIPCHRVIAQNGKLAGYGGGLDRKAYLISLEKQFAG